jgi:hypothetical protein
MIVALADDRLYRYHEELKVRDARAKGRQEGRVEVSCEDREFALPS